MSAHPARKLDDAVHQRVRLGILAVLAEAQRADFAYLRDSLELTDGNLAAHLRSLEQAGFVTSKRREDGGRPRTWVRATPAGRAALQAELNVLKELIARADRGQSQPW